MKGRKEKVEILALGIIWCLFGSAFMDALAASAW